MSMSARSTCLGDVTQPVSDASYDVGLVLSAADRYLFKQISPCGCTRFDAPPSLRQGSPLLLTIATDVIS